MDDWILKFPGLAALDPSTRALLRKSGRAVTLPAGIAPFRAGSPCESFLFVVSGRIRVQMSGESGREIVLYRVVGGETCILTTSCLVAGQDYPAEAWTETAVSAVLLPQAAFRDMLDRSSGFRNVVLRDYGRRVTDLILVVGEVSFGRIDVRLARLLLQRQDRDGSVSATHAELAVELGTAREVVSRQLKEFERQSWVALGRGQIALCDLAALRRAAERA